MIKFYSYIQESKSSDPDTLHAFDMDDTLIHHDDNKLRVHVVDNHGNRTRSLSNREYNSHDLPDGHRYDFSEFTSSKTFQDSSKPIKKMIAKLKSIKNSGGHAVIVTARSDLDDQPGFAKHMKKFGIDINDTHVYRAGSLPGKASKNKALIISDLINKNKYKNVHLYDDSHENLDEFLKLKKHHPEVALNAHHVLHEPDTGRVNISSRRV